MTAHIGCPICKLEQEHVTWTPRGDGHDVECARCGPFKISGTAVAVAAGRMPDLQLCAWIRSQNEAAAPPTISSTTLDSVANGLPTYRVSQKQNLFLQAMERRSAFAGMKVHVVQAFDFPLAWCASSDELNYLIRALMSRGLIQLERWSDPQESFSLELTITPTGWTHLDELIRHDVFSNQVFVAMSFSPEMRPAWTVGIQPAVASMGFQPYRVDAQPHIDRIDNKIIAEIKNSRFLVADVTLQRPGVYFEAGFALGLGLPVFWSVREDDLNHVHFDTRQYNHIVWKTEKQLAEELGLFIAAVIGRGTAP